MRRLCSATSATNRFRATSAVLRICLVGVVIALFHSTVLFHKSTTKSNPELQADEDARELFRNFAGEVVVGIDKSDHRNNDMQSIEVPTHSLHDGQNITWMADLWIPPRGSRMYSAKEMQRFFAQFSMLFMGDSTVRRAYATLYAILNSTKPHIPLVDVDHEDILDRGKRGSQTLQEAELCRQWSNSSIISPSSTCRPMPNTKDQKKRMDLISASCFSEAINILQYDLASQRNVTRVYDIIVFSSGIWDTSEYKRFLCGSGKGFPDIVFRKHNTTMHLFQKMQSQSLAIVYRTTGFHFKSFETESLKALNRKTIHDIENFQRLTKQHTGHTSNLSYIDWGTPIFPRSVKEDRIPDDNNAYHYGLKGRMLFLQQLMNHLLIKRHQWVN